MKIPAVAIAAVFGSGIVLGLQPRLIQSISSLLFLIPSILCITAGLCLSLALALREKLAVAGMISLGCWIALGAVAAGVSQRPLPAEHVLNRIALGTVDLKSPLRWHGRLRAEPARLPWGYGIDVDLTGVDAAEQYIPVSGGMRVGFTPREEDASLPEIHAGDGVTVIAQARLPLMYRDAGAFNRREYLAQQNIHLLATMRASSLLQSTGTSATTISSLLARMRGRLRDRLDEMFSASPEAAAVLRAMLLGDRSFIERSESVDYQKTGVFHVLVVAGLHIGALAFFLFLGGPEIATAAGGSDTDDACATFFVCFHSGAKATGSARGVDDGNCFDE